MRWLIGIDEAGYGPNLGPLVMTSVACRVHQPGTESKGFPGDGDLWHRLQPVVRRHDEPEDGRLVVADSKLVYSSSRGLAKLERTVLGTFPFGAGQELQDLSSYIEFICPQVKEELQQEPWYSGKTSLPVAASSDDCQETCRHFGQRGLKCGVTWGLIRSVVVCPARFNTLLERFETKSAILGLGLTELLRCNQNPGSDAEPAFFTVDKQGGRNYYSALVQQAFREGMVLAREEKASRSSYEVLGLDRAVQVVFEPRADAAHLCVALASMYSKYLREVLMLEFNRFWQGQVPNLKATAGYPGDAGRFYSAIRPVAARLGIPEDALWRRK